jgi:hypothetical protein
MCAAVRRARRRAGRQAARREISDLMRDKRPTWERVRERLTRMVAPVL